MSRARQHRTMLRMPDLSDKASPDAASAHRVRWPVVCRLGTAQTLSWASSYYLPAMLAVPMARDVGVATPTVFLGFSLALVVSALVGPTAGRAIDRHGGRPVLVGTHGLFAAALLGLAFAQGSLGMFAAWALMGLAMGCGLYEAAFATLVRLYGRQSRDAITGITLIAGFASTVGWPLSAWMESQWGWRGACVGWAALHLLLGLPLNLLLPRPSAIPELADDNRTADGERSGSAAASPPPAPPSPSEQRQHVRTALLLSLVFSLVWFTSTAMATHLPMMLQATGASVAAAVAVGALVGPAQVAGRLLEFGVLRRVHPLLSARLAGLTHPLGVVVLVIAGPAGAAAFALLHGVGNGIMTIAKGTLPLVLFGAQGYGALTGWMMMPARVAQAAAPVLFGLALEQWGASAMWLTGALGLIAALALWRVRAPDRAT